MKNVIGVDPGLSGALALFVDGEFVEVLDMPTIKVLGKKTTRLNAKDEIVVSQSERNHIDEIGLARLFEKWRRTYVGRAFDMMIEQVGGRPGQNASSTFNFGKGTGKVLGVAAANGVDIHEVPPATWKVKMGCTKDKDTSRLRASQLFPEHAGFFTKKADGEAGRSEAALIGMYAIKHAH